MRIQKAFRACVCFLQGREARSLQIKDFCGLALISGTDFDHYDGERVGQLENDNNNLQQNNSRLQLDKSRLEQDNSRLRQRIYELEQLVPQYGSQTSGHPGHYGDPNGTAPPSWDAPYVQASSPTFGIAPADVVNMNEFGFDLPVINDGNGTPPLLGGSTHAFDQGQTASQPDILAGMDGDVPDMDDWGLELADEHDPPWSYDVDRS
jgi:hypothetical protein